MVKQVLFQNGVYTYAITINANWLNEFINKNGTIDLQNVDVTYGNDGEVKIKISPIIRQAPKNLVQLSLTERVKMTHIAHPPATKFGEAIPEVTIQDNVAPPKDQVFEIVQHSKTTRGTKVVCKFFSSHYNQDVYYTVQLVDIGQVFTDYKGFVLPDLGNCKKGLVKSIQRNICSHIIFDGELWKGHKMIDEECFD